MTQLVKMPRPLVRSYMKSAMYRGVNPRNSQEGLYVAYAVDRFKRSLVLAALPALLQKQAG